MTITRDKTGKVKSSESARELGRKGGRTARSKGFAREVRKLRLNGFDYLPNMAAIACDPDHRDCVPAAKFLAEREFGKVPPHTALDGRSPKTAVPGDISTTAMLSAAKEILALELARLKAFAESGSEFTETESARLTECVKQLGVLVDKEADLFKNNPYQRLTDEEFKQRLSSTAGNH